MGDRARAMRGAAAHKWQIKAYRRRSGKRGEECGESQPGDGLRHSGQQQVTTAAGLGRDANNDQVSHTESQDDITRTHAQRAHMHGYRRALLGFMGEELRTSDSKPRLMLGINEQLASQ